jgi:hypothetical protein
VDIESLTPWIAAVASLSALIIGLVTALWAYTKFIVERGLLPPTQFEIECNPAGTQHGVTLLEIILHLRNLGSSALIASNIRVDVRYLKSDDVPGLVYLDGTETTEAERRRKRRLFGRVDFSRSLRQELEEMRLTESAGGEPIAVAQPADEPRKKPRQQRNGRQTETRGFSVMAHDTFIQSGVDQQYAFQTAVPGSTTYVLVWSSFEYAQSPKALQRAMLSVSRRLGLVQFTLMHVVEAHTTERVFKL